MSKSRIAWFLASLLSLSQAWAGPVFEPVAAFQAGPIAPENGTLLKHHDGFFYGTSRSGGAYGFGCLYRVNSSGEVAALVHFTGAGGLARGKRPQASLIDDGTGSLWGTTSQGGAGNSGEGFGTVFKFNPVSFDFTSVVEFTGTAGFAKGRFPQTALTRDGAGQLWGTTSAGGAGGHGTIFRINPTNLVFISVLDFTGATGANRGRNPLAPLVFDGTGAFWGTTAEGGTGGNAGTLFSVNAGTSSLTTRVDFTGTTGAFPGSRPAAALTAGESGIWWGTTSAGGANGNGTVFRYSVGAGSFSSVAAFTGTGGAVPGRIPATSLVSDASGSFYGTTNAGGSEDFGTIYKVNSVTSAFTPLIAFTGNSGAVPGSTPHAGLVPDGGGSLWGVTVGGGTARQGSLYKIAADTGAFTPVVSLLRSLGIVPGSNPVAGLTSGPDGLLWGSTERGGVWNLGILFTINPLTGAMQRVLDFTGTTGVAKGSAPSVALVNDGAGFLWGVTTTGGAGDLGTLFKINPVTRVFTTVVEFLGNNGRNPLGRLVADGAGNFWGTTSEGGSQSRGTVFRINMASAQLTTVADFTGTSGNFPGDGPSDGLTSDGAGFLWGITYEGGTTNRGTVYKINAATSQFTNVLSFDGDGDFPGDGPRAALTPDANGFLWGVTEFGGAESHGILFKIKWGTGVYTRVIDFTGVGGAQPGSGPGTSLIQDPAGAWYGTTESGGVANLGTIFKITAEGVFSTIAQFSGAQGSGPGEKPRGSLLRHTDGHFYSTTFAGGQADSITPAGNGSIYRLRFGPLAVTALPATLVDSTSATLNASVNPNGAATTVTFEYGTSPTLADALTASGGTLAAVPAPLTSLAAVTGLLPFRTYYYRVKAVNGENANPQFSPILSFNTPSGTGGGGGGFSQWLMNANLSGGAAAAGIDSDLDGTANALEYLQGTNPSVQNAPNLPGFEVEGNHMVFTFQRQDTSETPDVSLRVEVGSTLDIWPVVYNIGATTAASDGGVVVEENGLNPDTVRIMIPLAETSGKFARLRILISP